MGCPSLAGLSPARYSKDGPISQDLAAPLPDKPATMLGSQRNSLTGYRPYERRGGFGQVSKAQESWPSVLSRLNCSRTTQRRPPPRCQARTEDSPTPPHVCPRLSSSRECRPAPAKCDRRKHHMVLSNHIAKHMLAGCPQTAHLESARAARLFQRLALHRPASNSSRYRARRRMTDWFC